MDFLVRREGFGGEGDGFGEAFGEMGWRGREVVEDLSGW